MRIRSVKPELVQAPAFASLSDGAARLFYGLLAVADDYGRCPASTLYLAGQILYGKPRPANVIARLRNELEASGWVQVYTVRGAEYLSIVGWLDVGSLTYQLIKKTRQSRFPAPGSVTAPPPGTSSEPPPAPPDLDLDLEHEREREAELNAKGNRTPPPSWLPGEEARERAASLGADPREEAIAYMNYCQANSKRPNDFGFAVWLDKVPRFGPASSTAPKPTGDRRNIPRLDEPVRRIPSL